MENILKESLQLLPQYFHDNELALLALTTKVELPFRDRWAYALSKILTDKQIVAREWKRTDLAILEEGKAKCLIELKAMYTFDAALFTKNIHGYAKRMADDAGKAKKLMDDEKDEAEIYTFLLATHPHSPIPPKYQNIVKYRHEINRAFIKFKNQDEIYKVASNAVRINLKGRDVVAEGVFRAGCQMSCVTEVYYWLVKS